MATPIVIVASGGLPITEAANGYGMPVSVAANGYGTPCTLVASGGLPVVGSGGGNVLWTPLNLGAALVEWWDAQSLSASPVSSWTGKKLGTVASAVSNQPTWSATARNGKPGLTFASPQVLTFVPTGFPSGSAAGGIGLAGLSSTNPNPITNEQFAFSYGFNTTGAGQSRYIAQQTNTDTSPGATQAGTGNVGSNIMDTFAWGNTDRFVVFQISGQNASINTDGNATVSAVLSPTTNTGLTGGAIGSWPAFGFSWAGVIQQVFVTSGILSTSQRQKLEGWESWYDGKAGTNLVAGHPYAARAPFVSDP